jgi:hypothetical protein
MALALNHVQFTHGSEQVPVLIPFAPSRARDDWHILASGTSLSYILRRRAWRAGQRMPFQGLTTLLHRLLNLLMRELYEAIPHM